MSHTTKPSPLTASKQTSQGLPRWADQLIALIVVLLLSPVVLFNCLTALLTGKTVLCEQHKVDALGRNTMRLSFSCGFLQNTANLWLVITGRLRLCGTSCNYRLAPGQDIQVKHCDLPSGLISLHDVRDMSGLAVESPEALYQYQSRMTAIGQLSMLLRFSFNWMVCRSVQARSPALVPLFGLNINNTRIDKAIDWFCTGEFFRGIKRSSLNLKKPKISFFVNANSINLAQRDPDFKQVLQQADCLFADGSGMRMAARSQGIKLTDNINGTDVLPLLCRAANTQKKRVFLLGAKPGVAEKTAANLKKIQPGLQICGVHHGFFSESEVPAIIERINHSGTHILLVAQGSPLQESWVIKHASVLNCESVLAVGGLFDFYSGNIARAPLWMRETGLEWVWRLLQEPIAKCERYVLGVPEFMFRTFILRQAGQE